MSSVDIIQHAPTATRFRLRESASAATRASGKSLASQMHDILQLSRGFGGLSPREYYYFGLYDDERFPEDEKQRFIGLGVQSQILWRCTDGQYWAISRDKLLFAALMAVHGFPLLNTQAVLHRFRVVPNAQPLRSLGDAAHFLRHEARFPLFTKPVKGMRSAGSARIDGYDAYTDELLLVPGHRVRVDAYLASVERYFDEGYLFQDVQHPHERIRALCGDRLATVRVVMMVGPDGGVPFRAMWKVPAGPNVADNFWRAGNILCGLDPATGRVTRAISGTGTDQVDVANHPDTGVAIKDFVIPHWDELLGMCRDASSVIPGITLQGWDVCITDDGPLLVEVNVGGDFTLPQLGHAKGMLDERFKVYLDAHGFRPSRPAWGLEMMQSLRRHLSPSRERHELAT